MGTNQVDLTGLGTPPNPLAPYTGVNPPFSVMYGSASISGDSFIYENNGDFIYSTSTVNGTGFFFQFTIPAFVVPYPVPIGTSALSISLYGGIPRGNPPPLNNAATCSIVFDPNCQNYMTISNHITNSSETIYDIGGSSGDTLTVIADGSSIFLFINNTIRGAGIFPSSNIGWGGELYGFPDYSYPESNFTVANIKFYPYEPSQARIPCFVEGTRILTPTGYRPVETLSRGDKVITADGRIVSVRLYRTYVKKTTPETAPYRIPPGLFIGQRKELLLSPMHAFQIARDLWEIPRYAATRYPQIRQVRIGEAVTYYHVELPDFFRDHLVINNGVITESYGGNQCDILPCNFRLYRFSVKKHGFIRASLPQKCRVLKT